VLERRLALHAPSRITDKRLDNKAANLARRIVPGAHLWDQFSTDAFSALRFTVINYGCLHA
jgi:hypothetical protein